MSAAQGNPFAQYSLGGQYYYGNGVEQSYDTAFEFYSEAFQKENPFAAYELGKMHRDGVSSQAGPDQAQNCFKQAYYGFVKLEKENGGDQLQHRLGQMCLSGEGTEINIPAAIDYFNKAMDLGNVHSMHALTKLYRNGAGAVDIRAVIQKLTQAAESNNDFAQFSLGCFYAFDKGERDREKAMHWLTMAAGQGNEFAEKAIEFLNNPPHQISAPAAVMNILRHMSKIIADDYLEQRMKYAASIDKKLMQRIIQKKESQGMKQTFE
jgi:TPR repeat protein